MAVAQFYLNCLTAMFASSWGKIKRGTIRQDSASFQRVQYLTININASLGDGKAKKSKRKFETLTLIFVAVILPVVVAVMQLLAVPDVECAKFVGTIISTLPDG